MENQRRVGELTQGLWLKTKIKVGLMKGKNLKTENQRGIQD